jgi:hypothetical protein
MTDAHPPSQPTLPTSAPTARARRVLASLIAGAGLDEIGLKEKITRKRTEKILRDELSRRWVAPAQEFTRLQIARLDGMILKLIDRVQKGELEAIDRALKIVDRLDRYHGFTRANRAVEPYGDEQRERLLQKLNDAAERLQSETPEE